MRTGQRLRDVDVELLDGSQVTVGRHPRDAAIVLVPHAGCERCRQLHGAIQDRSEVIGWWGSRLLVTRDDDLRSLLGLASGEAALVVIDRFGVIWEHHVVGPDEHDGLPDADAVEESAKYLGTQCPECGVPDRPYTEDRGWGATA